MSDCNHTAADSCLRGDECAQCLRDAAQPEKPAAVCSALLDRLHRHIAILAPHQKERRTGQLLIEATKEIERLEAAMCSRTITLSENVRQEDYMIFFEERETRGYAMEQEEKANAPDTRCGLPSGTG